MNGGVDAECPGGPPPLGERPLLLVAAVALVDADGRLLIARRPEGKSMAGLWEFPGGKCDAGETLQACLVREMREELAVDVEVAASPLLSVTHAYPEKVVALHFFACTLLGDPEPQLGQEMRWVPRSDLDQYEFPAADRDLITLLRQ